MYWDCTFACYHQHKTDYDDVRTSLLCGNIIKIIIIYNLDLFLSYLSKLDSIICDADTPYVLCCGDFNANINCDNNNNTCKNNFGKELLRFCGDEGLVLSDQVFCKGNNICTFYSESHHTVSWIDHILSTVNAHSLIEDISINNEYVTSDHLPVSVCVKVNDMNIDPSHICASNIDYYCQNINWTDLTKHELNSYKIKCQDLLSNVYLDHDLILCNDSNCKDMNHKNAIDNLYTNINACLIDASSDHIKHNKKHFQQIAGWNDICKESHMQAREAFLYWRSFNKPKQGPIFDIMKRSRAHFKQTLRQCKAQEKRNIADSLAKKLLTRDSRDFWKEIKKINAANCMPLASTINGISGHSNIADLWQNYFKGLLNTCKPDEHYYEKFDNMNNSNEEYLISPITVYNAIKELKCGKSYGMDGLYSEHFKYASDNICILLSIAFNCMIIHGYLPSSFMQSVIVPVIKNKKASVTEQDNYRPIAIASACSKILEIIILNSFRDLLSTRNNQFGFKGKHGTDMAVFALKSVIDYYVSLSSCMYICYIDASKAFDRISHCKLFDKLMKRNVPKIIVRLLYVWYSTQHLYVRWGNSLSTPFHVTNGVRQGGILSPALFNVYIDDLSKLLVEMNVGCNVNGTCINHLVYADDTVLLAPSPSALQQLIDCCERFASSNDIIYNSKKTVVMCIKSKKYRDIFVPDFLLYGKALRLVSEEKYLGCIISDDFKDDCDIYRQMRSLYSRGNLIVKNFKFCSEDVKLQLFRSYCNNLYCGQLWSNFKARSIARIRVAFNNVFRALMGLRRDTSISSFMVERNLDTFNVLHRKVITSFMNRIASSENDIIATVVNSLFFQTSKINKTWTDIVFLL